jgi:hypothetical protein
LVGIAVMQLTMMGVLALKSGDPSDTIRTKATEQWSEYAKMVIGVAPLLPMTYFVYSLLQQAYEKQIRNVPLEVVGAAQRSFMQGNTEPFTATNGQELSELNADIRLRNRLSVFSNISTTATAHPVELQEKVLARHSMLSLLDPTVGEESPFHDPEEQEIDISFQHASYEAIDTMDDQLLRHVEPPMTRVTGILDIPIGSAMIKHGEQDIEQEDVLLYSYLHPALIGRLPIPWLPNQQFEGLRKYQVNEQKRLLTRFTHRQRLSLENGGDETVKTGAVRAFIDGFTSWIHLALS